MPRRSCATCRDRRILCDRAEPKCGQCIQSNRHCKGYGFRLFWPSADNGKRSLFAPSQHRAPLFLEAGLVNVSSWDIELHENLLAGSYPPHLVFDPPKPYNTIPNHVPRDELLEYFQSTASTCLSTFGHPTDLGKLLLQMALANDSPSSTAVLHSVVAYSSRHRDGLRPQAANNKISALNALQGNSGGLSLAEAAQHVATAMMLCTFETFNASCTAGQWPTYLLNAKSVIRASVLGTLKVEPEHELAPLLDWVFYHDVLARFSRFHWRRERQNLDREEEPSASDEIWAYKPPCSNPSLLLLSELLEIVMLKAEGRVPAENEDNYRNSTKILGFRIRKALPLEMQSTTSKSRDRSKSTSSSSGSSPSSSSSSTSSPSSTLTNLTYQSAGDPVPSSYSNSNMGLGVNPETETYLLHAAMLIYLYRSDPISQPSLSSTSPSSSSSQLNSHPLNTLKSHLFTTLLPSLPFYTTQFALLLIGAEASTDAERVTVLELLSRTEKVSASRDVFLVRKMIEAVWVQGDLGLVDAAAANKNKNNASAVGSRNQGLGSVSGSGSGLGESLGLGRLSLSLSRTVGSETGYESGFGGYKYGYLERITGVVSCCPFIPSFS